MNGSGVGAPPGCLLVQYTAQYGGSPISGLTVVDAMHDSAVSVTALFGVGGPLEREYRARGCEIHVLPHGQWLLGGKFVRRAGRWRWEVRAALAFARLLRELRPRLVYVNTLMSVSAVIAARMQGIPVVWHVREQFTDENGEMHVPFGGRGLARALVRHLPTAIVCVSRAVQLNVIGPAPCRKARVLANALEKSYFDKPFSPAVARERFGLPDAPFIVGVPGTLRPVKGHGFLLAAAAQILAAEHDWRFIISGEVEHEYGRELRRQAKALGISDSVHFLGPLSDMRSLYAAADIICVPSRGEPFGRTVIEAFAQERAVIATRVGGIPESITDRQTGLLVDFGDLAALVAAMRELRADADLRGRLVARALESAKLQFHEDVFRRKLGLLLSEVIDRP